MENYTPSNPQEALSLSDFRISDELQEALHGAEKTFMKVRDSYFAHLESDIALRQWYIEFKAILAGPLKWQKLDGENKVTAVYPPRLHELSELIKARSKVIQDAYFLPLQM